MLSKVPGSIFRTSGAVGWDGGRSGPERSVELKNNRRKGSREDVRTGLLRIRKEKEKEVGKKEQTCNAVSCLTGPPAPTLTACRSVCRWRHCREEGFHTGWCHPFTFPPPFFHLLSNTLSLHLCLLHTWAARLCAGGWDGFRKQVKISAVCPSLGILVWCNPFPPLQPSQACPTQADLLPLSEGIWNVCYLGYHSQFAVLIPVTIYCKCNNCFFSNNV